MIRLSTSITITVLPHPSNDVSPWRRRDCDFSILVRSWCQGVASLVIQQDGNNRKLSNVIVAAITTTTHRSGQPTQFVVNVTSPVGQQSGLAHDSVVTCENLATIEKSLVRAKIGSLPPDAMTAIDRCLKVSLGIA